MAALAGFWYLFLMRALFVICTALSLNHALAQQSHANTIKKYFDFTGSQSLIYTGAAFTSYDPSIITHPYFTKDSLTKGAVRYDGVWYEDIPLLYDIFNDRLIVCNTNGNYLCPSPEKIERFLLDGHTFIQTPKGYYDLLTTGKLTIEAKRQKVVEEFNSTVEVKRTTVERNYFFAVLGGKYTLLNNIRSLIDLMGEKKETVRQYLRQQGIDTRKDKELALIKAADYYNNLSR
jgi:hypothetical protein